MVNKVIFSEVRYFYYKLTLICANLAYNKNCAIQKQMQCLLWPIGWAIFPNLSINSNLMFCYDFIFIFLTNLDVE